MSKSFVLIALLSLCVLGCSAEPAPAPAPAAPESGTTDQDTAAGEGSETKGSDTK